MSKSLPIYFSFLVACMVVIMTFVTARTYTQLSMAIILYPMLAYLAYKILPYDWKHTYKKYVDTKPTLPDVSVNSATVSQTTETAETTETIEKQPLEISDINKRVFLKLIGGTGISFFLISLFSQKAQAFLFGQNLSQGSSLAGNPANVNPNPITASPTDGYNISEVDDSIISYYGFINKDGQWFIMKGDTNTGSFRYTKGKSNFPDNWNKREGLKYDYYQNIFAAS
ncbi:MAG: hypothetical protein Q7R49_05970 [Candidatus Daviesbacteria bacterium]|nr:hypothetical protein [Candidatus Daviesbacteria bacterium]